MHKTCLNVGKILIIIEKYIISTKISTLKVREIIELKRKEVIKTVFARNKSKLKHDI